MRIWAVIILYVIPQSMAMEDDLLGDERKFDDFTQITIGAAALDTRRRIHSGRILMTVLLVDLVAAKFYGVNLSQPRRVCAVEAGLTK